MIPKILHTQRGIYIWLGGLVFLFLLGMLSVRNVLHLRLRYAQLRTHAYEIEHAEEILLDQQVQLKSLEQQLLQLNPNRIELSNHNHFVRYSEQICADHGVQIVSLPVEAVSKLGEYQVASIAFTLEGTYHGLLQVLYDIEQRDRVASIQHLNIRTEEIRIDFQQKKYLIAEVVLNRLIL